MKNTDFTLEDVPEEVLESAEVEPEEVKAVDDEPISGKEEYAYENTENSIKIYLPETSGEYVAVTDSEDYSLSLT